jgi:dihydroorotase-like cyclic amidohydrolase
LRTADNRPRQQHDYKGNILIGEDRITWMGEGKPPEEADYILDADGLIVSAGFIDPTATCGTG